MDSFSNDDQLEFNEMDSKSDEILTYSKDVEIEKMTNIKYLRDTSYDLFNEIFSDLEFENMKGEKININDYQDFYNFQIKLNSDYDTNIKYFDYKNRINVKIIKEIPYKATRLRALSEEDDGLILSPNGNFVKTLKIDKKSNSTLEHYNTVIGNSLILKGAYYYEIKILEIGDNTDMCFGIISRNSLFLTDKNYKNFPLCEFEDCYGFNLNNIFYDKYGRERKVLSVGTIISIKVDLKKNKLSIYFDGEKVSQNSINIKDGTLGYYPAISLSSGKEIQVKFGGIYNLYTCFKTSNQVDAKPISQYNNLENIVSCYMKIIDNCLNKIISHRQISYNDSMRFFYPMINFFSNIAFNDEYIMKNYILKFMFRNYFEEENINKFFDKKFNFLYLVINNIEKSKQQRSILFLLDCLCEDIENELYITWPNEKLKNISLYIKLYHYFLKQNLFKNILIPNGSITEIVYKKIKYQLSIIFQSIKICGISYQGVDYYNVMEIVKRKVNKFIINKNYIDSLSGLIETLLDLKLENKNNNINMIDKLIMKIKNKNIEIESQTENSIIEGEKLDEFEILVKYLFDKKNKKTLSNNKDEQPIFIKNREMEYNSYRIIFLNLINDIFQRKSGKDYINIISTVFLSLLNLYNIYYLKENSSNFSNEILLSYLPILYNDRKYLNNSNFQNFNYNDTFINDDAIKSIKNIIDSDILYKELNKKQYNNSSYLIKLIINLSSFFEKELFDFDIYLQYREYDKIIKRWKRKRQFSKIDKYICKLKDLILLNNAFNNNIINRSLESLIPYFKVLFENNFYLFLPLKFLNLLKFFIKFIYYRYFIFIDKKTINNDSTSQLIQLFVDINFKLLCDENTNKSFFISILENIKFLYNMFLLKKEYIIYIRENHSEEDNEIFDDDEIKGFTNYIKANHLNKLIIIIKIVFSKDIIIIEKKMKYLKNFLMYFNPDIFSDESNGENIFISHILNYIESNDDDFWFVTFIINYLVKKKLIRQLQKTENFLRTKNEDIDSIKKEKLKVYFCSISKILNFISRFITSKRILNKYFDYYIDDNIFENNLEESGNKNDKKEENEYSIFCYFIYIASLIIKNLLSKNFLRFCEENIDDLNKHDYNVKYLVRECFKYLVKVFIAIPEKYQKIIERREKNNNKKKKNNINNEKNDINENLKHYYKNIINNIKTNDIMKLSPLIENNILLRSDNDEFQSQLRKFILHINQIETEYNLFPKESKTNEGSQDLNICPICLDKENDIHVSPCNHMFCFACIKKLNDRRCPICRENIKGVVEHPEFKFNDKIRIIQRGPHAFRLNDEGELEPIIDNQDNMFGNMRIGIRRENIGNRINSQFIRFIFENQ